MEMIKEEKVGNYMDSFLQEDLELISESNIPIKDMEKGIILITGATGLIGSLLVKTFACLNRRKHADIKILALVRNVEKAKKIFGDILQSEEVELVVGDITEPLNIKGNVDYIIHCASVTTSKVMISSPVNVIYTSLNGTENILELAKEKNIKSMVYVSSMEVYGTFEIEPKQKVTEEMLGYINPLSIRSNYPESKRMCENMCVAYASQYNVPVKIARLAQTFGAGVLSGENRVFAQFARSVIEGKDIILHTAGKSEGNYCYTRDVIKALLILLNKGKDGEAYNIANEECHITISEMAHMVAEDLAEGAIEVVFDIPETNLYGYAHDTKMHMDSSKMQKLGWYPEVNLKDAYRRLIGSMKCQNI
ncbi:NAD-dependent epimerase/dehydratase family protein [Blautia sp. HCP28S3_G10]|uniref:NAD-dependent epimerase/dehydratase family protein n=1 Tax=Blautia sp. HCP28S3_G10 TaxID=3438908 RepID=UPI003F89C24A